MSDLDQAGRAVAARDDLELETERVLQAMLEAFTDEVADLATDALAAPTLLAAGSPFVFTNVQAAWRRATKRLAESRTDLVPEQVLDVLVSANLPSMVYDDTVALLVTAREEGWSTTKTRRSLARMLRPSPYARTLRTDEDVKRHEAYKTAVRRIARTTATYNYNSRQIEELAKAGFRQKRWVTYLDKNTRPAHGAANGTTVPLVQTFAVGGESLMFPGDIAGSPAQTYNCRCVVVGVPGSVIRASGSATLDRMSTLARQTTFSMVQEDCLPCQAHPTSFAVGTPVSVEETTTLNPYWEGPVGIEGEMTGDGRFIEPNALRWEAEDFPLPFRHAPEDNGGHDGAVVVGHILTLERRSDGVIWGTGDWDLDSVEGREAARHVEQALTNGVSMDLDDWSFEVRVASEVIDRMDDMMAGEDVDEEREVDEEGRVTVVKVDKDSEVMVTTSGRIRAATLVSIPAFSRCRITPRSDETMPMPELSLAASVTTLHREKFAPPLEWFANPGFTERQPFRIEDDGRVYGHLAEWGVCHISHTAPGQCILPPRSPSNYTYFLTGYVVTEDGTEVPVGRLTAGTGHADEGLDARATLAHYDNSGYVSAFVNIGEDAIGIWVAGALAPGITERQKAILRSTPLSGDWRRIKGHLELVAGLAVNTAGFPIPRPKALVAGGHMHSLVAAGMIAPTAVVPPGQDGALSVDDLRYLKRLAAREREDERARMERSVHAMALARRVERIR